MRVKFKIPTIGKIKVSYIFLSLMIIAKGIGLDSSNIFYYAFSIIAVVWWGVQIFQSKWNYKPILCSMMILALTLLSTALSGKLGLLLTMMAVICMKELEEQKVIKMFAILWTCCFILMMVLVSLGIVQDNVVTEMGKTWHGRGYLTGNLYHATFGVLLTLYLYIRKYRTKLIEVIILQGINVMVYHYSQSRTGLLMGIMIIMLFYSVKFIYKKRKIKRMLMVGMCIIMLFSVIVSIIVPAFLYDGNYYGTTWVHALNILLSGRIQWIYAQFSNGRLSLFGTRNLEYFLDNAYTYILFQYGLISFAMILILYFVTVKSMIKRNNLYGIIVVMIFVVYGITEQFFTNSFMNFSWLLVGNELMNIILKKSNLN